MSGMAARPHLSDRKRGCDPTTTARCQHSTLCPRDAQGPFHPSPSTQWAVQCLSPSHRAGWRQVTTGGRGWKARATRAAKEGAESRGQTSSASGTGVRRRPRGRAHVPKARAALKPRPGRRGRGCRSRDRCRLSAQKAPPRGPEGRGAQLCADPGPGGPWGRGGQAPGARGPTRAAGIPG